MRLTKSFPDENKTFRKDSTNHNYFHEKIQTNRFDYSFQDSFKINMSSNKSLHFHKFLNNPNQLTWLAVEKFAS